MNLEQQLLRDEGEKLAAYTDTEGYLTIGVGRLIDSRKGGGISPEESRYLLRNDIKAREAQVASRLPWSNRLDDARRGVLLNMAFQLGISGLLNFRRTLALVEAGHYLEASREMLDSTWARQTPNRAKRLSEQMRTGKWV